MKKFLTIVFCLGCISLSAQQKNIYHKGWIDFNKNGVMDVFEDPSQPIDKRVEDLLSQMTLEEKTCQMATLYGYGRVLKDEMSTPNWKNEIWKDGIANIDEELSSNKLKTQYSFPYSKHAEAINTIQKWFVEETRLGIPVDLRERVFDKFFRATRDGDVRTRQPTGTGMGLAIAKGIVEAHEGRIWIDSGSNGKGTRVVFTLPIGDEEESTDSSEFNL